MSGIKGRPTLPDTEKKARGTYKPSRAKATEPKEIVLVDAGEPLFALSPLARDMWDAAVRTMMTYGTLTEMDIPLISMMCAEYDSYIDTLAHGDIELGADMCTKPSGYRKVRNEAMANIIKLSQQLGVSAVVRHKMRKPEKESKAKDPMDGFV